MTKDKVLDEVKGYLFMVLGCIAYAISTSLFLEPNSIVAGGVTGIAVLIKLLNENAYVGMISIAINLPILLLSIRMLGWKFVIRCLITVATLGVITDLLASLPVLTHDGVLASLYGGICQGVGIGLLWHSPSEAERSTVHFGVCCAQAC
jgi:uncharacterized membrane-anchored protein YitT (DUF2179 family)